ncbi:R3H domain-containing protein 2-like isoform X4 [Daphnia pulicaria]|nr:R3H domain-containing protein 2-like isoform X4 [Daphnia pulicaria]
MASSTEDWAGSTMEDEELPMGEYATSSPGIEVGDQVDEPSRASSSNEDNHRNSYLNDQKRSSHQADLVSSQSTSSEGEYVCRHKKMNKMKLLVRSHALREAASPPPDSPSSSPLFNATTNSSSSQPVPDEQQQQQQQQQQASLVITVVESHDETSSPHHQEVAQVTNRLRPRVQVESSQCSVDSSSSFVSFSLSRDSSTDLANGSEAYLAAGSHLYTDNTGVDLHHFIIETLHRNYKDRMTLLRIEQDMIALVRDTKRTCHRFPAMSSYHRMLVHRVAAYFGMEHNVDQSGNCVVVSKSRHTRLPEVAFKEYVRDDVVLPEEPNRKLNPKRETVSFEEPDRHSSNGSNSGGGGNKFTRSTEIRSRSLEERDCVLGMDSKAKNRAFQPQVTLVPEGVCCPAVEGATTATGARRKENLSESTVSAYATPTTSRTNSEDIQTLRWPKRMTQGTLRTNMRIPKVESFDSRDLLGGYGNTLRPTVAKSYSFGGYTATCTSHEANAAVMRGGDVNGAPGVYQQQHNVNTQHHGGQNYGTRFLSKQVRSSEDSNSSSISISRSSPTSSGYKSQHSAAPSPTPVPSNSRAVPLRTPAATCNSSCNNIESQNAGGYNQEWNRANATVGGATATTPEIVTPPTNNATLLWAVTSLDDVPAGSILINPQTGQPFYNSDGSAYRYDPHLPLPFQVETNVNSNSDAMGEIEQADNSYESYDRPEVVVKAEDNEGSSMSSVPVYPAWAQQCYESPISPTLATSYVNQPQAYFGPEFASFHPANGGAASNSQPNGYFVQGPTVNSSAPFDDQMKGNCVAVPVAHGHGYVLYQACLGPSGDNGASIDANDLYSAMKNLSLRPIGGIPPMSYPLAENLTHQVEMASTNGPFLATVPIRPANISNGKMQAPCNNLPPRSGSTPPTVVTSAPTTSLTSNAYLASMRAQSNSQMMQHHQQMQQPYNGTANVAVTPYPSMVYPLVNTTAHSQGNRQHYFPSSLVHHQFNNAAHQYVSSPWSLVTTTAGTNRGTPERETNNTVSLEMPSNRMVAAPHSPNRVSCLYGPSLPSPFLTAGECGAIRQSSTVLHRQFSLPTPAPPAMYTLRPRIQQQQQTSFSSSSLPRPATSIQNQQPGVLGFNSSRHVRTRRQVFRPHAAPVGFTTDPSSVMQSHSSSPVQQFPSPTS